MVLLYFYIDILELHFESINNGMPIYIMHNVNDETGLVCKILYDAMDKWYKQSWKLQENNSNVDTGANIHLPASTPTLNLNKNMAIGTYF